MKNGKLLKLYEEMENRFSIPQKETLKCSKMIKALAKIHSNNGFREDLEHDGWLLLLEKISANNIPEHGNISAYYRKSINKKMNQRTKYYYREHAHEEFCEDHYGKEPCPETNLSTKLATEQVLKALDQRTQKILKLYYYDEATLGEIAAFFGLSSEGVRKLRDTGLKKLRAALEQ